MEKWKRGDCIVAHHPRGGRIVGTITGRERISGYGPRFVLDNGHSIAAADIITRAVAETQAERLAAMLVRCPHDLRAGTMRGYIARGLHYAFGSGVILSVEGWRDGAGWTWNNWHAVGRFSFATLTLKPRALLRWLREEGYLSEHSRGRVRVEDDGYNVMIEDRRTGEPLFALEYGNHDI